MSIGFIWMAPCHHRGGGLFVGGQDYEHVSHSRASHGFCLAHRNFGISGPGALDGLVSQKPAIQRR